MILFIAILATLGYGCKALADLWWFKDREAAKRAAGYWAYTLLVLAAVEFALFVDHCS